MRGRMWDRFFRVVWRINGVAILLILFSTMAVLLTEAVAPLLRHTRPRDERSALAPPDVEGKPTLRLTEFAASGRPGILRARLVSTRPPAYVSSGAQEGVTHNFLFLNTRDGKTWWLLPDADSTVIAEDDVTFEQGEGTVLARLIRVQNGDDAAHVTLLLTDVTGVKRTILATGVLEWVEVSVTSPTEASVVYLDSSGHHLLIIDPAACSVVREVPFKVEFPPRH